MNRPSLSRALALALVACLAAPLSLHAETCPYIWLCVGDPTNADLPIGSQTQALGAQTIAMGGLARTNGSIAIGNGSYAGYNTANNDDPAGWNFNTFAVAIGAGAGSTATQSLAVGTQTNAGGAYDTAIGSHALTQNNGNQRKTAIGAFSLAGGGLSTAVGAQSSAAGNNAFAGGAGASASAEASIALLGEASGTFGSIAIGRGSISSANSAAAFGAAAYATASQATAIGYNSLADQPNTVSVGTSANPRRIVNVAPGTAGTDAVNLQQLNDAIGGVAGGGVPWIASTDAVTPAAAQGINGTALGAGAAAGNADTQGNVAVGPNARAGTLGSSQAGTGGQAVAIGSSATAVGIGGMAIGYNAVSTAAFADAYGSGSLADEAGTASFGNAQTGSTRRLVNVTDGINPSDAMTVRQGEQITATFGGGASLLLNTAPTYIFTSPGSAGTYNDVGTALGALDRGLTAVNERVDTITTGDSGSAGPAGPQGPKGDKGDVGPQGPAGSGTGTGRDDLALHYDDANHGTATLGGSDGTTVKNVHAGVAQTDAANVGQVQAAVQQSQTYTDTSVAAAKDWSKAYTDQRVDALNHSLNKKINAAGAVGSVFGQMALSAGSVPQQDKLSMGIAGYKGESAIGVAYTHCFENDRVAVSVGAAFAGSSGSAVGVSLSVGLGGN